MAKQQLQRPTRTDWQNFVPPQEEGLLQKYGERYGYSAQQAPQEEAGLMGKLWESTKAVGEGLTFLPGGVVDTVQDVVFGFDPTDKAEMAQRTQREQELQAYQQKYAGQAFEGVTDAMSSIPYSLVTMGAGLAGGVAGGFAGPVGAGAAGMAASGTAAYRASKPQFQRTLYQATTEALGREPSPEEWGRVESNFEDAATRYGLWEAGPEAISNLLMVKILGPLGSKFKGGVKDVIKSVAGLYGEELATETITQMGQGSIEAEIGLRENAPGVLEAFNEVAPATFWQTTLMAGGKKGLDLAFQRTQRNGQTAEPDGPLVSEEGAESVPQAEARGVGGMLALPPAKPVPFLPEDSEDLTDWLSETEEKLDREFGPEIVTGQTVDLLDWSAAEVDAVSPYAALPEGTTPPQKMLPVAGLAGAFALPQGGGFMPPAVSTAMPMSGTIPGSRPIAPPTDFSTPIPQPSASQPLALPQQPMAGMNPGLWSGGKSQLAYGPKPAPIPAAQQILNVQPTPRADTTAQAQALGIPAPDPMPAASALGAGAPTPAVPNVPTGPQSSASEFAPMVQAPAMPNGPQANLPPMQQTPTVPKTLSAMLAQVSPENKKLAKKLERKPLARLVETEQAPEPFSNAEWTREDYPLPTAQGGTVFTSGSGRKMTPFPVVDYSTPGKRKSSNAKAATWLLDEAKKEAAGNQSFMRHLNALTPTNLPPATVSELAEVLINGAPEEAPRILKPLSGPVQDTADTHPKPSEAQDQPEGNAQPPAEQAAQEGYPKPKWGYGLPSFVTAQYGGGHDVEQKSATPAHASTVSATTPVSSADLSEHFARKFQEGTKYANIGQARRESFELTGKRLVSGTNDVKALDEAVELGVVRAARTIIADMRGNGASDVDIFRRLVDLYHQQPNLGVRTSTSVAQQAYSTPAPLAFLASHLAGITDTTTVYEPTAGNGMLVTEANPEKAVVNELNAERAERLRSLGFTVTEKDAASHDPGTTVDVVIANPPFGRVRDDDRNPASWTVAGYDTKELDHAIALKALEALQPNGRAVLIVGGKQGNDETRANKYQAAMQRQFYRALFDNYKVVDQFTVDGKLYERQGAGYPVDFIVINGKGRTEGRKFPAADLPRIYDSFEALEGVIHEHRPEIRTGMDADGGRGAADSRVRGRSGNQGRGGSHGATVPVDSAHDPDSGSGGRGSGRRGHGESVEASGDVQPGSGRESAGEGGLSADRHSADLRRQLPGAPHKQDGSVRGGISEQDRGRQGNAGLSVESDAGRVGGTDAHSVSGRELVSEKQPKTDQTGEKATTSNSKPQKANAQKATAHQEPYTPRSEAASMGTLVPRNMASPLKSALKKLEKRRGYIDNYVAKALGYSPEELKKYFAGEQIDAIGLAIDNISQGSGFIIGDQTGIGKGRVNAAIIRYAKQKGLTPVSITMKPDLYADMIRDLNDIGEIGFNALPTNAGLAGIKAIPLPDGRELSTRDAKKHTALLQKAAENDVADFDAVFTTYDQLSTSGKEGKEDRREFMRAIAPNALFILDESHNAGGSESGKTRKAKNAAPSRAEFVREILALSPHGAFYSSATYAKRPDVMSLYFKTDMRHAVDDIGKLAEAVSAGGIPLQQVVAAQLTESGQYIRRERSFEGASVEVTRAEAKLEHAEQSATIMRTILAFDTLKQKAMEAVKQDARGEGEDVGDSSATGEKGANSTNFTSIMHNLIGQSLLAMKAKAAADEAALAVERGEKPVLTLANTMGSFIEEHVRGNGVQAGEELNLSFKDLFRRYLQKTRTLTKKDSSGKKVIESRLLTDKELGEEGVAAYNEVLQIIDGSVYDELPISPIDFITAELEQRGITVGEITGRTHAVEYLDGVPHYRARKTSSAQNIETMRRFNNGELDTMILNQSGSTGISLHSSSTFTDQRRRTMIIVQPELNIDVFMQTLGRVFRTGQVVPPSYKLLTSDIPAEKRPAAVLGKKMAGLNANTTASRTTDTTFQNIPDFLNEYGDIVTAQIMADEPELHAALGNPLSADSKGLAREDAVRKVTGRIPMLPLKEQQALYERIEADYKDLIAQLEATGGSALEAKTLPLDARLVESSELTPAREDVATDSPFAAESRLGLFDVKVLGKPYTPDYVTAMVEKGKDGAPEGETVRKETLEWLQNKLASMENEEARDNLKERVEGQFNTVREIFMELPVGTPVLLNTTEASFEGIVTRHDYKGKGNPSAPSAWRMTVAVADAAKQITVPYSKIAFDGAGEMSVGGAFIRPHPKSLDEVLEKFAAGQSVKREKRYIAFGNVLAAYASVGSQGQVINFEDSDGNVRAGILYKKDASRDAILGTSAVSFPDFEAISAFFAATGRKGIVKSADGNLVLAANGDQFKFSVPASKAKGAQFFLNGKLLEAAGRDFVKSGNQMGVTVDSSTAAAMVGVLREQGFGLVAGSHKEKARKVMGMDDKPMASLRKGVPAGSTVVGRISEDMAKSLPLHKAGDIRLDAEGIAHIEERHGKEIRTSGFKNTQEFVRYVLSNVDAVYQGNERRNFDLVSKRDNLFKRAIIKLEFAEKGDFYRVITANPIRGDAYNKKIPLWEGAQSNHSLAGTPGAFSGQSGILEENDTATSTDVNDSPASLSPGEFLPPRRETWQRLRTAGVRRVADALAKRAKNAVPTKVVGTFNELPARVRRAFAGQDDLVEGVYYDGTVWLVAENLTDEGRVADVWLHEQVGHHGVNSLFRDESEKFRTMNQLWQASGGMGNKELARLAERYGLSPLRNIADRMVLMEEYIASVAEKMHRGDALSSAEKSFWHRFVEAVKRLWAKMVLDASGRQRFSADVEGLLKASGRYVMDGVQARETGPLLGSEALASVNEAVPQSDAPRASLRDLFGRDLSDEGLAPGVRLLRKVLGRGVSEDVEDILSNPEMGKLVGKHDMSLWERLFKLPYWVAKDHPGFARVHDRQTRRVEERTAALKKSLEQIPLLYDPDPKNRLDKKEMGELRGMIHKWDGKKIPELEGVEKFIVKDKTLNGRDVLAMNPDFYPAYEKWLGTQPESARARQAFLQVRKSLDNDFLKAYAKMADMSDLADTDLEMYRTSFGHIPNYFPHIRRGKYFVTATTGKGVVGDPKKTVFRKHFDVPLGSSVREEWAKIVAAHKKEFPGATWHNPREADKLPDEILGAPIDASAMEQIIKTATARLGNGELAAEVESVLLSGVSDILKSRGFGAHSIERQNIPGYETEDIIDILYVSKAGLNGWLTKMEAASDFATGLGKIKAKDSPQLWGYASQYIKDMLRNSDRLDRITGNIKTMAFAWYLGGNIKTAVVNLTQNFIIGIPRLQQYVTGGSGYWLKSAMDTVGLKYSKIGVAGAKHLKADELQLIQELFGDGVINDAYMEEVRGQLGSVPGAKLWNQFVKWMGMPMSIVERFNRASLALAAYRAARAGAFRGKALTEFRLKRGERMTYEQAKAFAATVVRDSHFVLDKGNQPEFFRSSVAGRMLTPAYTFRSFGANTLNLYYRALRSEGPEGMAFVAKSLGATMALGGLTAFPFYATMAALCQAVSGDDDDWTEEIRKALPESNLLRDVVCYGVPSMAGVSIGGSLRMETPVTGGFKKGSTPKEIFQESIGDFIGIPYDMLINRTSKVMESGANQSYDKMAEALLPVFVANMMQAWRLHTEGQTTKTGKPINDPGQKGARKLSASESVGKALGFQPVSSTKSYDAYSAQKHRDMVRSEKLGDFATAMLTAREAGDVRGMVEVRKAMKTWNEKMVREGKPAMRIKMKDVQRRMVARRREAKATPKNKEKGKAFAEVWGG